MSVRLDADGELAEALAALRDGLGLAEQFPAEVEAEARAAIGTAPLPDADLTEIPFITIDPEGATDLDQALHLERESDGYRVRYAIADVSRFVRPDGAIDAESRRRGQTIYAPDGRIPLYPVVLSEDAASLLADRLRSAFVWTFVLDRDARVTEVRLRRARVRSRSQLSYEEAQRQIDGDNAPDVLLLLKEVGEKRLLLERERGGASLGRPDQRIIERDGRYVLELRHPLPCEAWNAQLSLMTGMAAAQIMIEGRVGILRTMPPADRESVARFRHQANALGQPWPEDMLYGEYLRMLRPSDPRHVAIMHAAASLFRGAGYTAFDGEVPEHIEQSAIAAPYAHSTAPLRRLVDRFVLLVCESLDAGRPVAEWVRAALPTLPAIMAASDGVAARLENGAVAAAEAAVLRDKIGDEFDAVVISENGKGGTIQLLDPPVTAPCSGALVPGTRVRVRLLSAEVRTAHVQFALVTAESANDREDEPPVESE